MTPPVPAGHNLLLSYAQCSRACLCLGLHERSPFLHAFLTAPACLLMVFHLFICLPSSGHRLPI
jgi:hypothetical protein